MLDCCIVSMPYGALCIPSLGIGQLVASLRQSGVSAEDLHATFWFAERIGFRRYVGLCYPNSLHLGELTFSAAAFPDFMPDYKRSVEENLADKPEFSSLVQFFFGVDDIVPVLEELREEAVNFISDAAERVLALKPAVVGCSSMFEQHCASLALLRTVKEMAPDTVTIMGGANCEGTMGQATLNAFEWLDFVVSGEADILLPDLVKSVRKTSGGELDPASLPAGVFSRHALKPLEDTDCGGFASAVVAEMDDLPRPEYGGFFKALGDFSEEDKVFPVLPMETSRGCGWGQHGGCTFCGMNGQKQRFRSKSPDRVHREMRELYERYGLKIKVLQVTDNMFPPEYCQTLLPQLQAEQPSPYTVYWPALANLNEEQLSQLAASNVRLITPGIESLSDGALKLMNKPTDAITNVALLKAAMEKGVALWWIFLYGIPGEDLAWYREMNSWLELILHLQPPRRMSSISYHRFSKYHQKPQEYGLELVPHRAYGQYVYPLPEEQIADLAYYFDDKNRDRLELVDTAEYKNLRQIIHTWGKIFSVHADAEKRVTLSVLENEKTSIITDTRPCATPREIVLTGPIHAVHQACHTPRRRSSLAYSMQKTVPALTAQVFDRAVAQLIESKLLLQLNGKLLSLALREPTSPILKTRECVMGYNIDGKLI